MAHALENEAISRNLTIDELVRIDEPWCAVEVYRRLRDDHALNLEGWIRYEDHERALKENYSLGVGDGTDAGKSLGYKAGYTDSRQGKEFNKDY